MMLLSEAVPLRASTTLNGYQTQAYLPWVYGDLRHQQIPTVRISASKYLVADHPMTVTAVYVDSKKVANFTAVIGDDGTGNTVTYIEIGDSIGSKTVTVSGTGKLNPRNGQLLDNPADVVTDIMTKCGYDTNLVRQQTQALRVEFGRLNVGVAGVIFDGKQTIRQTLIEICQSVGVIWLPDIFEQYPSPAKPSLHRLDSYNCSGITCEAQASDYATTVECEYFKQWSANIFGGVMSFAAAGKRPREVVQKVSLPWLNNQPYCRYLCSLYARRAAQDKVRVKLIANNLDIKAGDWVSIDSRQMPFDGVHNMFVLATEPSGASLSIVGEILLGNTPAIVQTGETLSALIGVSDLSISVRFDGGQTVFIITDSDKKPVFNALITIDDDSTVKRTNIAGEVVYSALDRGVHVLTIQPANALASTYSISY